MAALAALSADERYPLTQDQIDQYHRDGFITLHGVFQGKAFEDLRAAVEGAVEHESEADWMGGPKAPRPADREPQPYERVYVQRVDLWRRHADVAAFTKSRRLADIAARLQGSAMKLWHDQALFKEPDEGKANHTPWHQDSLYWPVSPKHTQTTAWIALRAADRRNGCLNFIAGSHKLGPHQGVDFNNPIDVFEAHPELRELPAVPCPLEPGDCTFHNSLTYHFAGSNRSKERREGYAVIFMPADTRYNGAPHPVTEVVKQQPGAPFDDNFPLVADAPA